MPGKQLSYDLRQRIISAFFEEHQRVKDIAERFDVNRRTAARTIALYSIRQTLRPLRRTGRHRILDTTDIRALTAWLERGSSVYLDEIQSWLMRERGKRLSISGVSGMLDRHKITRKVLEKRATERNPALRAAFLLKAIPIDARRMCFIDEVGFNKHTAARRYGWSLRSRRAYASQPFVRNPCFSVIVAINYTGVVAYLVVTGAVNSAIFMHFILSCLAPHIQRDGNNSVLIMDNAKTHHDARLEPVVSAYGAQVLYLSPYSPDFNPIELMFGVIKKRAKRMVELLLSHTLMAITVLLRTVTGADCRAFVGHCYALPPA